MVSYHSYKLLLGFKRLQANLLPDSDVLLSDKNSGVVDGLGESELEDLSLEPALQEVLDLETEHIIELHAALVQHSDTDQTTQKCISWMKKISLNKE